jgi:hypothetical protein
VEAMAFRQGIKSKKFTDKYKNDLDAADRIAGVDDEDDEDEEDEEEDKDVGEDENVEDKEEKSIEDDEKFIGEGDITDSNCFKKMKPLKPIPFIEETPKEVKEEKNMKNKTLNEEIKTEAIRQLEDIRKEEKNMRDKKFDEDIKKDTETIRQLEAIREVKRLLKTIPYNSKTDLELFPLERIEEIEDRVTSLEDVVEDIVEYLDGAIEKIFSESPCTTPEKGCCNFTECGKDEGEKEEYEEDDAVYNDIDVTQMARGFRRLLLLLGED